MAGWGATMTNPIPQAAVDAACDAYHRPKRMITNTAVGSHYDRMTAALEAAMPHLRKQIAAEIRAMEADPFGTFSQRNPQAVRDRAALIAEGENK